MTSLLMQSLTAGSLANFVPWIAIIAFLYIAYLVYIKRKGEMVELLTTQKILVPVLLLIGLAITPSSVMALFGMLEPVAQVLVQITTAVLSALLVHAGIAWIIKNFTNYF